MGDAERGLYHVWWGDACKMIECSFALQEGESADLYMWQQEEVMERGLSQEYVRIVVGQGIGRRNGGWGKLCIAWALFFAFYPLLSPLHVHHVSSVSIRMLLVWLS